jgi:hypothetical protein
MTQPRKPVPEPRVHELLNDEISRLVMRADGVARHEVEALVTRARAERATRAPQFRKTERVS